MHFENGTIRRPDAPDVNTLKSKLMGLLPPTPNPVGIQNQVTGRTVGADYEIVLLSETVSTGPVEMQGVYSLGILLQANQQISFRFSAPMLAGTLPPPAFGGAALKQLASQEVSKLVNWGVTTALATADISVKGAVGSLTDFITAAVLSGTPPTPQAVLSAAASLAGDAATLKAGPFSMKFDGVGGFTPTVDIGPIAPEFLQGAVTIGKLSAGATLALNTANPISAFHLSLNDVRLGKGGGGDSSGLVEQLLPNMRDVPGFTVAVDWKNSALSITGGGKIPIQKSLGPLEIVSLLVELQKESLTLGVDLFFKLGPITVVAYELGLTIPFDGKSITPFLHGLGVSFDGGGIKLTGLFLEVKHQNAASDYIGGAVVSIVNLFELSAIGGYSKDSTGDASLFIFASLVAPLGGPPFFFITGVAGGFGFNRKLPAPELLSDHPFLKVMRGDISFDSKNPQAAIKSLANAFVISHGEYWIAAGLQFTCFAFINGKVIVAVSFGKKFSFNLLGLLSFGISPIAYFELAFVVTADEDHFLLKAGLTPNSYIIDLDIFSLRGDFAMGAWYADPHAGDFVISIGGYHPYFHKPDHYPDLARVGCKALLYDFVHLSVECFFACTPQALMAGAAVSLWAEFAGIAAGLDVYVDVLITWDLLYLVARLGVTVWFEFLGRHEIVVQLEIHTSPFGCTATIELFIVSFTISFGADAAALPGPKIYEFISNQLPAPAKPQGTGVSVAAFNTDKNGGLFRVDFTTGRTTAPQKDEKKQEGLDSGAPVQVNSEFVFTVKTKLPIAEPGKKPTDAPNSVLDGHIDLPLCDHSPKDLPSTLTITGSATAQLNLTRQLRLIDRFPAANFGDVLPAAQAGTTAREAISKIPTDAPSLPLSDGIQITYYPTFSPLKGTYLKGSLEKSSAPNEEFPLPLQTIKVRQNRYTLSQAAYSKDALQTKVSAVVAHPSSRQIAAQQNAGITIAPLGVLFQTSDVLRVTTGVRTFTVAKPAAGVVLMDVPVSPARRLELFPVKLAVTPARVFVPAAVPPTTRTPSALVPLGSASADVVRAAATISVTADLPAGVTLAGASTAPVRGPQTVSILPKKAARFVLSGGSPATSHRLTSSGTGNVRAVYLGGAGEFLGDAYTAIGATLNTPPRTRQVIMLHEGTEIPVGTTLPTGVLGIRENIGVEKDSTLCCIGDRNFAAHGCVLHSATPLPFGVRPFDTVPGSRLLAGLTRSQTFFPLVQKGATLVLIVEPNADDPAPAREQVRWAASNATLSGILTVVAPDRTAFLMTVDTATAWSLDVDLGPDWRIAGVIVATAASRVLSLRLQQSGDWNLVDDRIATGPAETAISVTLTPIL